ncbi:hypothetical protein [Natranaerofaba carboxydovora]|uniref:hypothetical protein n=1 Tax=Natranaerofaba carboxydovora TaxID=2742683 RepID=UPI001F1443E5|nr:hypothetical protein [Natranaerofaba carboxydovora]UMZ73005.1 hypothetical protein ACONDI_00549 [Natranaerofaba carboxydovora]
MENDTRELIKGAKSSRLVKSIQDYYASDKGEIWQRLMKRDNYKNIIDKRRIDDIDQLIARAADYAERYGE